MTSNSAQLHLLVHVMYIKILLFPEGLLIIGIIKYSRKHYSNLMIKALLVWDTSAFSYNLGSVPVQTLFPLQPRP